MNFSKDSLIAPVDVWSVSILWLISFDLMEYEPSSVKTKNYLFSLKKFSRKLSSEVSFSLSKSSFTKSKIVSLITVALSS